jgi:sulfhydrogenase subunit alpha
MNMATVNIEVNHVTRIEGHGTIVVDAAEGKVKQCKWQVPEAPRFFEAMLVGRPWHEITPVVSRICGICSVSHSLVSHKAIEAAMNVTVSQQSLLLRNLIKHAENIQSHILHVGYLVLPDLLGTGSVFPLAQTHKDAVLGVVQLHRLANDICTVIGGRTTHPIRLQVGGLSKLPQADELRALRERLGVAMDWLQEFVEIVASLAGQIPPFERETEYIALTAPDEYALYDGALTSSDTGPINHSEYAQALMEYVVPWSTAKWVKHRRGAYMVGALARFNLMSERLTPAAARTAARLGLAAPCHNPFMNSVAQVVECVYSAERAIDAINELLDRPAEPERVEVVPRAGRGIAIVEAPRGLLIHDYTLDAQGRCLKANLVIPTNQNHGNIQADFDAFVPNVLDQPPERITLLLEMLVRAYDPCVSCSTH